MPVTPVDSQEINSVSEISTVGTLEHNCESAMNFYQSPSKPDCNGAKYNSQVSDVKSSNVIGTRADPLSDAAANDEDIISRELSGSLKINIKRDQLGKVDDPSETLDSGGVQAGKQDFSGSPESHAVSGQDSSGSPESNIEGEGQLAGFYDQNYPPLVKSSKIKSGGGVPISSVNLDGKTRSWMEIVTLPPARVYVKVDSRMHGKMNCDFTVSCKVEDSEYVADLSEESDNPVEKFMELWNTDVKFRKDYVKSNEWSTLRRFGTLDGRSLDPPEKPHCYDHERVDRMISTSTKVNLLSRIPTREPKKETIVRKVAADDKFPKKKTTEDRNQVNKQPTENEANKQLLIQEEAKKLREETRLTEKAKEILRREESEAKMKEQLRLEEMAKAAAARERKERQAEKLQMRAELKALKEAEEKEKVRLRRLAKKERRKAQKKSTANDCEAIANSEGTSETRKEESTVVPKKPKAAAAKPKPPVPPAVRNRNKKTHKLWMWAFVVVIGVCILFWLGNSQVLMKLNAEW